MAHLIHVWFSIGLALAAARVDGAPQHAATERMRDAKQLYESAEYEQALDAMDGIDPASITTDQARQRAAYRALCLLALDRSDQAQSSIAEQIARDPLFRPASDMPPRLRSLVEQVSATLRPKLLQQHYKLGKERFDANDYPAAIREFTLVIDVADAAAQGEPAQDDIRTLAAGFRDLARRASTNVPSPTAPAPAAATASTVTNVVPPTVIRQDIPRWPSDLDAAAAPGSRKGLLEIVVGPTGEVESAKIVKHIHPHYDALLLAAARNWSYEPASRDGKPIEYTKMVEVTIVSR